MARRHAHDGDHESEHGQIVRALAAGAHEYLIKPFTPDALRDKLSLLGLVPVEVP